MPRSRYLAVLTAAVIGLGITPPTLQATLSSPGAAPTAAAAPTASSKATVLRVGTFNVRTARARQDQRTWLQRSPSVAREILSRNPGVVALQELGPGRADGQKAKLNGSERQTTSLISALSARGGSRYKLVRSTPYVAPGSSHGTQGARILYDSSRYSLLSDCPETTGRRAFNPSCAFDLPVAAGDSSKRARSAAYAGFRDRRTGRKFYVVSAHLDNRHSKSDRVEAKYNRLRKRQATAVATTMATINTGRWPVVFGGDINAWQRDRGRYAPHRALAAQGYRDAASAGKRVNIAYPTVNHWYGTLKKSKSGSGPRLDVVMVKGGRGAKRYENKMARVNPARPSDHNLVLADVVL